METNVIKTETVKESKKRNSANSLTLLIGTHKVALKSNVTSLQSVKAVVGAFIKNFDMNPKETKITLPNGTVIAVNSLDNARNFAKVLFPHEYLDKSGSKGTSEFMDVIKEVQKELYSLPINWDLVGTKDSKQILSQYKKATQKAIEGGKITVEQTKLIA